MRDKNRIKPMLEMLQSIWELYPDMRFNQLIDMLQRDYKDGEYVEVIADGYTYADLFYVEDEDFYDYLFNNFYEIKNKI